MPSGERDHFTTDSHKGAALSALFYRYGKHHRLSYEERCYQLRFQSDCDILSGTMACNSILKSTLIAIWLTVVSAGCGSTPEEVQTSDESSGAHEEVAFRGEPHAVMETDRGTILIRLLPELAPMTVDNFVELAETGFYSRTVFHRVLPSKMIQGGDPNSKDNDPYNDGQGNSGKFLKAEFSSHPFSRGTVAMARQAGDPDSSSSQFFVVLERSPEWDGDYTLFGEVVEGLEVADEISRTPLSKDERLISRPVVAIRIKRIVIEYREVTEQAEESEENQAK
jgi:peptidyl-prolyl cis-trans isomerase B (cyclophilin B)